MYFYLLLRFWFLWIQDIWQDRQIFSANPLPNLLSYNQKLMNRLEALLLVVLGVIQIHVNLVIRGLSIRGFAYSR